MEDPNKQPVAIDLVTEGPPILEEEEERFALTAISSDVNLEEALKNAERALQYIDSLRGFVLQRTKPFDWTNQSGNPYLGEAGVTRFGAAFKMFHEDIDCWIVDAEGNRRNIKEKNAFQGTPRIIMFDGVVGSQLLGLKAKFEGGAKLDDGLWSQDDYLDYMKKAKANFVGRAYRKLLGLQNMTWEELTPFGITRDNVQTVNRLTTAKADTEQAKELWGILLEMNDGDPVKAEDYLEKFTTSDKYKGKRKPSQLTEKQMAWVAPKIKGEYYKKFPDKKPKNGDAKSPQTEAQAFDAFILSVKVLADKLGEADFKMLLVEEGITAVEKIPPEARGKFLFKLNKKIEQKGGK